jgi:hemoglobin
MDGEVRQSNVNGWAGPAKVEQPTQRGGVFTFFQKNEPTDSTQSATIWPMDTARDDIRHADDIRLLIDTFYAKVTSDDTIGYIFNEIARVDWAAHLPVMYAFWEFLLLGGKNYTGNPIEKHHHLHAQHPLTEAHFDRWVALFQATVDELFVGPVADSAKFRAFAIASTWKPKFTQPHGIGILTRPDSNQPT